jgi:predicted flap endonuclease-1-like 5' DNA nuclease
MDNFLGFLGCFYLIPSLIIGGIGFLLGWFLKPNKRITGDLSVEGEGALRAEADSLRARVHDLEGHVASRDGEVSDLKAKLAAAGTGAALGAAATAAASTEKTSESDDTYALEWQNRYLAARVKYLESRIGEASESTKAKPVAKKTKPKAKAKPAAKKKAPAKKPAAKKAAAPKPKVLYTDGPTDGAPDDLKLIKGIGPKFEKDLNGKGIYYFRQIGAWKRADVKMVEGVIDSIPGRIDRDEWVKQAKVLAKGGAARPMKGKPASAKSSAKKTPGRKPMSAKDKAAAEAEKRLDRYYAGVTKYDAKADRDVVKSIVKYCGAALKSRDSSLVACTDEAELQRVAKGFVTKKLGQTSGQMDLVQDVCTQMKAQRLKNRVTFYYLAAKKVGKLDVFK